ncbi:MAG TPA: GNAT family N-acetyltransferase [Actinomycetes bacterium]
MADASVRPAVPADAGDIARVQAAAWSRTYAGLLPAEDLAAAGSDRAEETWRAAVTSPPSQHHRVLTALSGERVVGFAALSPAGDPDLQPALDAELHALCVDPERVGAGHGSRLVNAAADVMRAAGFDHLHVWVTEQEAPLQDLLRKAGWEPDGAARSLDLRGDGDVLVGQVRLSTRIGDDGR